MTENTTSSGNSNFNEVPSWYQDSVPEGAGSPAPPAPGGQPTPGFNASPSGTPQSGVARAGKRFGAGLVARLGIGAVLLGGGALFTLGSTSANDLEPGDCFVMDDSLEINRVDTPGCSEPHDSEVVGIVEIANAGPYPIDGAAYWDTVLIACDDAALNSIVNFENIPGNASLQLLLPLEAGWDAGDRTSICVINAPGGITGSLTNLKE